MVHSTTHEGRRVVPTASLTGVNVSCGWAGPYVLGCLSRSFPVLPTVQIGKDLGSRHEDDSGEWTRSLRTPLKVSYPWIPRLGS